MSKINYDTYQKPSRFVKLNVGDNRVRIVSDGIICYEHGMVVGGRYTPLGECTETVDCEQCLKGSEPKLRFKWIAYLPEIDEVRVLAVGTTIGDEICVIGKKMGKKNIEVIINRVGLGKSSKYRVTKAESTPMSPEAAVRIKEMRDYLAKKYLGI